MKQMVQCRLERRADVGPGIKVMTAWIEDRAANVGSEVELLPSGEFWRVMAVYNRMQAGELKEVQRQRRKPPPSIRDTIKDKRQAAGHHS